ncbi:MAG TPA: hypothetical protein VM553_02960 [Dongiaceae bacterium]|nr:hypothetical protein [Dongiaceae bacterium]
MFTLKKRVVIPATALLLSPFPVAAKTFTESLATGKAFVNERLRYENVDDEAFDGKAEAMTIRSRVGYETAPFAGFTALIEFEDVHALGGMDTYQLPAPPVPANTGDAVIADPEVTELNRAQIRYRGISRLDLIAGRQRIMYDNQRFIGNVGFRQDEQVFDAFTAAYTGLTDFTFSYAYVDRVYGITDVFDADMSDNLFNVSYNGFTWGKFIGYSYYLKSEEDTAAKQLLLNPALRFATNETVGLRFDGGYILPTTVPLRLLYRAEYAEQKVELLNRQDYKTEYNLGELGVAWTFGGGAYALTPIIGYELLGADEDRRTGNNNTGLYAFQTPYATKHIFNGWVDQFLVTPNQGLEDVYLSLGFDLNAWTTKILFQYHEYESDVESLPLGRTLDLGEETGVQVIKTLGANWTLGAKYGDYKQADDADVLVSGKKNADKVWVWAELNF